MPLSVVRPGRAGVLSTARERARRARAAVVPWIASRLPETVLQCLLIVISIVLALGVEEWKDARKERELKLQSLSSLEREIRSNRGVLTDAVPYSATLPTVMMEMDTAGVLRTPEAFYDLLGVSSFQPKLLKSTAWQTAMVTGVLRLLDYRTADALSTAYGQQADHERSGEQRLPDFLRTGTATPGSTAHAMVRSATRYVEKQTQEERDLIAAYDEALDQIAAARGKLR
jgi:hypothetical protein